MIENIYNGMVTTSVKHRTNLKLELSLFFLQTLCLTSALFYSFSTIETGEEEVRFPVTSVILSIKFQKVVRTLSKPSQPNASLLPSSTLSHG